MDTIERIEHVTQFNTSRGQQTLHPLVSVLDQSLSVPLATGRRLSALYLVFLKNTGGKACQYGRSTYDYQQDTLIFIAPGQVFGLELPPGEVVQPSGWALAFHPDLLKGTALHGRMGGYRFFEYSVNEALQLSEREKGIVLECFFKIREELERGWDKHSKSLIVSNIELLLGYCVRFYDRQFLMREPLNKDILARFEQLLKHYFQSDKPTLQGLPTVAYCADQLHLSSNYFGDLIKKETGMSALEFIQAQVIDLAKEKMFEADKPIGQIALEMGYKYPQHFARLFKQRVGMSPVAYRKML
ncbi:MAG: helix-turn-helix domain-containing protein [Bacteroidia bacterium]